MGIRASSGGQLGFGGTSGGTGAGLTVEEVQAILSEAITTSDTVQGIVLTSAYDNVTGKLRISLSTPTDVPIAGVIPASIEVEKTGVTIGAAKGFNFAGPGVGVISIVDDIATINITGGGGSGGGAGIGIANVVIDNNGHLKVSLDDGNVIDAGNARGPQGIKGDTGLQGQQGLQGPQGVPGLQGDTGLQGVPGVKGDTGLQGSQGNTGRGVAATVIDSEGNLQVSLTDGTIVTAGHVVGPQGVQGAQGVPGIAGLKGDTGLQGLPGTAGSPGVQGVPGANGAQGSTGAAGVSVSAGAVVNGHLIITKTDGATIDAGLIVGPQGAKGDTGATGLQGVAGAKGDTGATGTSYSVNNKTGQVQVFGLTTTAQAGYDLEVDIANKANKLTTARNIALSGKVTGLTSFDGSGNVTMLTSLNGVTTNDVAEGTNQYFTNARARAALSASTGLSYNSATGVMSLNANSDQLNEGTNNLYFTNNRFDNRLGQSTLAQFSDVANVSPTTGQALVWNGNTWTPGTVASGAGANAGSSSGLFKATVQVEYDASGNLSSVSILNGGISAVITTATSTSATVTFTFTGSTCSPMGIQVYGYQRTTNVYVTRALASDFPTRTVAAGGVSGAPTTFSAFDPTANTMTLGLTKAVTGASAGIGQTTHCVLQFLLSSI